MKRGFKAIHFLIIAAVAVIVAMLIGFFFLSPKLLEQTQLTQPQKTPAAPSAPKDESADWKTYSSPDLGLSLKYPPDYKVKEKIISDKVAWADFSSPELLWEGFGGGEILVKGGEIRINVEESILRIIREVYALSYIPQELSRGKVTLDGVEATYIVQEHISSFKTHQVIAEKSGRTYQLYASIANPDEKSVKSVFQKMLSTFRFLD